MENSSVKVDANARQRELRSFGYVMGAVIAVVFGLFFPWLWSLKMPYWPWGVAAMFGVVATVRPMALGIVHKYWMRLADVLGWINTRIILGIVFVFVFSPIGCMMRLLGKDTLKKQWNKDLKTYRVDRLPRKDNHMERQF